ncbi:hypothetical protein FY034_17200 (plasmid) [Trichlorobacter lovleyi]|uniref:hypothetical protein n=1 Tax=Trichlorobacter lovleyi TaxID=313985 RepID=UPI00223EAE84|nr:hypothetical protein [Trichlorobacter lovleyi]QOX80760.1 hypothetical protein FY034_17200 [Trichlorobacter lovleyi]
MAFRKNLVKTGYMFERAIVPNSRLYVSGGLFKKDVAADDLEMLAFEGIANLTSMTWEEPGSTKGSRAERLFDTIFRCYGSLYLNGDKGLKLKGIGKDAKAPEHRWDLETEPLLMYEAMVQTSGGSLPIAVPPTVEITTGRSGRLFLRTTDRSELQKACDSLNKAGGVKVEPISTISSDWVRMRGVSWKFLGKGGLSSQSVYIAGQDPKVAKDGLIQKLIDKQVPILPEWKDVFWDSLEKCGYITTLEDHRIHGFEINLPTDEIFALIGDMIKTRTFPRPKELPAHVTW